MTDTEKEKRILNILYQSATDQADVLRKLLAVANKIEGMTYTVKEPVLKEQLEQLELELSDSVSTLATLYLKVIERVKKDGKLRIIRKPPSDG
jgi:hypothetical protein